MARSRTRNAASNRATSSCCTPTGLRKRPTRRASCSGSIASAARSRRRPTAASRSCATTSYVRCAPSCRCRPTISPWWCCATAETLKTARPPAVIHDTGAIARVSNALAGYTLADIVRETQSTSLLRGTRNADGARVVVKLLRAEHPTPAQVARLRHEHALLAGLDVPEVVRTFGLVAHGRGVALVLEDLGKVSLESMFRHERPSLGRFLEVAIRMADAMAAIHRHAIIHKDIKPHHFLVTGERIKLIDFGIATRLSSETQVAKSASLLDGTLAYMSPEQTGRMNRSLDRRTDLYSLGVSLYQLLTGHLPFEASDPLELVHSHIARAPRPPHEVARDVPPQVSDIVLKLMSKGAEDRYQSAAG